MSKIINLNHVERLSKLIKGYDLIHGGKYDKKLNYFEPTILEVKSIKDKILKDEIYKNHGAQICNSAKEIYEKSEIILYAANWANERLV